MQALGQHLLIELYQCNAGPLNSIKTVERALQAAAFRMGLTVVQSYFHHFAPFGISGVIIIQESHLTIHTWPEYRYAAVDFFTCTPDIQPNVAIQLLCGAFECGDTEVQALPRGQLQTVGPIHQNLEQLRAEITPRRPIAPQRWFTDHDKNTAFSLRYKGDLLFQEQSPFQLVEVYDTFEYGRMLSLDHVIMCTERDEQGYHEMMVHLPMQLRPHPYQRVLVMGGGDGGAARELLRYPELENILLAELDEVVVRAVRQHLPTFATAFHDQRLELHISEGVEFLATLPDASLDLILVDAPDPEGPALRLFTRTCYELIFKKLKEGGMMVTQSESPYYRSEVLQTSYGILTELFGIAQTHCFLSFIPTYTSGMWSFLLAYKSAEPFGKPDIEAIDAFAKQQQLRYYNAAVHQGAFALPNFVQNMLREALRPDQM